MFVAALVPISDIMPYIYTFFFTFLFMDFLLMAHSSISALTSLLLEYELFLKVLKGCK